MLVFARQERGDAFPLRRRAGAGAVYFVFRFLAGYGHPHGFSYSSAVRTSGNDWFVLRLCYALLSVSALMAPTRQRMDYDVQAVGRVASVQNVCSVPQHRRRGRGSSGLRPDRIFLKEPTAVLRTDTG